MQTVKNKCALRSSDLHILAMGLMLCDHLWAMVLPAEVWLTYIGRIAYPIFAFLLTEGYVHTRNVRRYGLRLLCWALLSEVPFDLMYGGGVFYPYHQNVLWTLLLGLVLIVLIEKSRARFKPLPAALLSAGLALLGYVAGYAAMVDYYGVGVLTVLVFYWFRGTGRKARLAQLACLYLLNVQMLGGYYDTVTLFGHTVELVRQGFALLALIPIWLYRGQKGAKSKAFQWACYAFYPAHMLALFAMQALMRR